MNITLPRIYPITDVHASGLSHAEQVKQLIAGGACVIQFREKYASPHEFYESAIEALEIARERGVKILVNDRVDIALVVNADGVHLGQDDCPPEKAREILGERAIIGLSTHSLEQAINAIKLPIDYIAVGPIFPTHSKEKSDPVVGLEGLRKIRASIGSFPLVAIGGINAGNLLSVFEAGADSAAMIGSIVSPSASIELRMRELTDISQAKR